MTQYDWLFIFLGAGVVVYFTFARVLRALFSLAAFWIATLLGALLYQELTFRLQAVVGKNPILARGILFDVLLLTFFVAGHIATHLAFPVTKLPSLGLLDNLLGSIVGALIAVLLITLLVNSLGVMTAQLWPTNHAGWSILRGSYLNAHLRSLTRPVMVWYGRTFVPLLRWLPPALTPQ